jgi:hypothetical protein
MLIRDTFALKSSSDRIAIRGGFCVEAGLECIAQEVVDGLPEQHLVPDDAEFAAHPTSPPRARHPDESRGGRSQMPPRSTWVSVGQPPREVEEVGHDAGKRLGLGADTCDADDTARAC